MDTSGTYVSCGNLFWLDLRKRISPKIPLNTRALRIIINALFPKGPQKLPVEIIVPIIPGTSPADFQREHGRHLRASAEEVELALIFHIAERIEDGADDDEVTRLACNYAVAAGRVAHACVPSRLS